MRPAEAGDALPCRDGAAEDDSGSFFRRATPASLAAGSSLCGAVKEGLKEILRGARQLEIDSKIRLHVLLSLARGIIAEDQIVLRRLPESRRDAKVHFLRVRVLSGEYGFARASADKIAKLLLVHQKKFDIGARIAGLRAGLLEK